MAINVFVVPHVLDRVPPLLATHCPVAADLLLGAPRSFLFPDVLCHALRMAALGLRPAVIVLAAGPQFIDIELGQATGLLGFPALAALLVVFVVVVEIVAVAVASTVSALVTVTLTFFFGEVFVEVSGVTRSSVPGHVLGYGGYLQDARVVPASQVPMLADTQTMVQEACRKRAMSGASQRAVGRTASTCRQTTWRPTRSRRVKMSPCTPRGLQNELGGESPARSAC